MTEHVGAVASGEGGQDVAVSVSIEVADGDELPAKLRPPGDRAEGSQIRSVPAAEEASMEDLMELRRVVPEGTFAMSTSEGLEVGSGSDSPPSVRIPADGWELELALEKGFVLLRLFALEKKATVDGIRVRVARKGKEPSEAVTDRDGRIHLPLESGSSQITIHADPPFALHFVFPTES